MIVGIVINNKSGTLFQLRTVCSISSLSIRQNNYVLGRWHFSFYGYGSFYLLLSICIVNVRCSCFLYSNE